MAELVIRFEKRRRPLPIHRPRLNLSVITRRVSEAVRHSSLTRRVTKDESSVSAVVQKNRGSPRGFIGTVSGASHFDPVPERERSIGIRMPRTAVLGFSAIIIAKSTEMEEQTTLRCVAYLSCP
jgi:hypothetical protein